MKRKNFKRFIAALVVFFLSIGFLNGNIVAHAYTSSEGWVAVVDEESNGVRMVISPPHWGWASPEATYAEHINLVLYINGVEKSNYHIYSKMNNSGKKCIKAYETHERQYFNFSKCHEDTNAAIKEIMESNGSYSLADKIKTAIPWAIAAIVVVWIVKIVLSIILANPAPLLIPV